jgi:glycerophosphoryl diester phosphodiesterase
MGLDRPSLAPRIYGHRGSRRRRPENTLDAFRLALEEGAQGFETDVRRSADGRLVLFHDDIVDGRPPAAMTFDELAGCSPGLARPAELVDVATGVDVILEVKERGLEAQLVDEIAGIPRAVVCSFDHRVVRELVRLRAATGARFGVGVTLSGRMIGGAAYARSLGAEWFFPASSFVDEETVAEFREHGVAVVPWVMNHEFQWNAAAAWGCHGFITDDPLAASRWLASSGFGNA